jgi:hypothetical protein
MSGPHPPHRRCTVIYVGMAAGIWACATAGTATADPLPYGPDTCIQGYVWREANAADHVCVTRDTHNRTIDENRLTDERYDTNAVRNSKVCIQGFVWREAFSGDKVCVTPDSRAQAAADNAAAASRLAANRQSSAPEPGLPLPPIPLPSLPPLPGI